jgi:sugar phosphate isomerase/epimerase
MVRLTGVNDEPSKEWDLEIGLDTLDELGVKYVEMRAVDGQNVDDLSDEAFASVAERIKARGFTVTGYDSNLGKCDLEEENRPNEVKRMLKAIERANLVGSPLIRTMGFRRGMCSVRDWYDRTIDWFSQLARMAGEADKTLVLENCLTRETSMGCGPDDCLEIMTAVDSPNLRMNLDPGNFAYFGQNALEGFELLKDYVANVHLKDYGKPMDQSTACLAGDGIAHVREILKGLKEINETGDASLNPDYLYPIIDELLEECVKHQEGRDD